LIEAPDFDGCLLAYLSPLASADEKAQIVRHLFGSREAEWAPTNQREGAITFFMWIAIKPSSPPTKRAISRYIMFA